MKQIICLFGDSITRGLWDREHGGWAKRLKYCLENNNSNIRVCNYGVSGDTTDDLLARFDIICKSKKPQSIFLAIGINDLQYINEEDNLRIFIKKFRNNYNTLLKKAKKYTNTIVCLGLTKINENKMIFNKFYINKIVKLYNTKIKQACEINNVFFLDVYGLLVNSDLEDGIHPNSKGHKKMFLKVNNFLISNKFIEN